MSFTLTNEAQLAGLAVLVNNGTDNFTGKTINLGADLDLAERQWTPIGNKTHEFNGNFNGNNHTIKNLFIDSDDLCVGLFGNINGVNIKDLKLMNVNVNCSNMSYNAAVGSLVGHTMISNIKNCHVTLESVNGYYNVGGFVGFADSGTIIIKCDVTGGSVIIIDGKNVGGFIGNCNGEDIGCFVNDSYATSNVITYHNESSPQLCGGFIGCISRTNITNCYATGNVSFKRIKSNEPGVKPSSYGGFIGGYKIETSINITNCYATGDVNVMDPSVEEATCIGGFIGGNAGKNLVNSSFINCYATGNVNGTFGTGGFFGVIQGKNDNYVTVTNCFALNKKVDGSNTLFSRFGQFKYIYQSNTYAWDGMLLNGAIAQSDPEGFNATNVTKESLWNNQSFYQSLGFDFTKDWEMAKGDKYKLPIIKGAAVPNFDASYLKVDEPEPGPSPTPARGSTTIMVNFADTGNMSNLYYNETGDYYYTYAGKKVTVPLNITGDDNHISLGGYDLKVSVSDGTQTIQLTANDVSNLLNAWVGNKSLSGKEVLMAFTAVNGPISIKTTSPSFMNVSFTAESGKEYYNIYVKPNDKTLNKGEKSMFAGFSKAYGEMSIGDFDNDLFNASNTGYIAATIIVKDLAELQKFIVSGYAGDYLVTTPKSIDLLWERENKTGSSIIGRYTAPIDEVKDWTFDSSLSKYLSIDNPTVVSGDAQGTFKTNKSANLTTVISGTMNLNVSFNDEPINSSYSVSVRNWLKDQGMGAFNKIGTDLTWALNVSAAAVNTSESPKGWNTYANFTNKTNYTSYEIPTLSVEYSNGTTPVTADKYSIRNENGNESIMVGHSIFIKNNTIQKADTTIKILFKSYKLGDATMNEYINIADSSAMGVDILRDGELLNGKINKLFADVDGNGSITATDVQNMNMYLVGK